MRRAALAYRAQKATEEPPERLKETAAGTPSIEPAKQASRGAMRRAALAYRAEKATEEPPERLNGHGYFSGQEVDRESASSQESLTDQTTII